MPPGGIHERLKDRSSRPNPWITRLSLNLWPLSFVLRLCLLPQAEWPSSPAFRDGPFAIVFREKVPTGNDSPPGRTRLSHGVSISPSLKVFQWGNGRRRESLHWVFRKRHSRGQNGRGELAPDFLTTPPFYVSKGTLLRPHFPPAGHSRLVGDYRVAEPRISS